MTFKEHIIKSLDLTPVETIEFEGKEYKEGGVLPIAFTEYLLNMCAILMTIAEVILEETKGTYLSIDGEEYKPTGDTVSDIRNILLGNDFLRHTSLFMQTHGFNKWFLNKDWEDDDDEDSIRLWFDFENISTMWNKYASEKEQENN